MGDKVSILYPNCSEYLAIALATAQIGAHLVPVNWHLSSTEIDYIVRNSDSKVLFAHENFAVVASQVSANSAIARDSFFGNRSFGSFTSLDEALAAQPSGEPPNRVAAAPMFYTSGTSGKPKGVLRNVNEPPSIPENSLAKSLDTYSGLLGLTAGEGAHIVVAPLYHASPHVRALQTLHLGHRVVIMDKWDPRKMLALIEEHRISSAQMAPIMFHRLLQLPVEVRDAHDVSSLKSVIHVGAPCPVHVKQKMIDWWGPVIYEVYASTERSGTLVSSQDWLARPGTVGKPFPNTRIRILDDDGNELGPGEVGLIYIEDNSTFLYYKDPEKTLSCMHGTGVTAGDFGFLDADGWLYISDRRTDLILSGGVNIYPAEIEAVLMEHPHIADAAVIGLPDEEWGQRVHAILQVRESVPADSVLTQDIVDLCSARLAGFKRPRSIEFAKLPRNEAGKVSRASLRATRTHLVVTTT